MYFFVLCIDARPIRRNIYKGEDGENRDGRESRRTSLVPSPDTKAEVLARVRKQTPWASKVY